MSVGAGRMQVVEDESIQLLLDVEAAAMRLAYERAGPSKLRPGTGKANIRETKNEGKGQRSAGPTEAGCQCEAHELDLE
jgi:hypothetical protein